MNTLNSGSAAKNDIKNSIKVNYQLLTMLKIKHMIIHHGICLFKKYIAYIQLINLVTRLE